MQRHTHDSLVYYTFDSLAGIHAVKHAVSTRHGGTSPAPFHSLNLGHAVGDSPSNVARNTDLLYGLLDFPSGAGVTTNQVHGALVAAVGPRERGSSLDGFDALVTNIPGLPLLLRFADCVPILLFDPVKRAVGVAHSGWRGTVMKITAATVRAMTDAFGTRPHDLIAAIGPSIGPCCYCIGPNVIDAVRQSFARADRLLSERGGKTYLDLWQANVHQLVALGVQQIELAGTCTAEHTHDFYSARREQNRTGRFGAIIALDDRTS